VNAYKRVVKLKKLLQTVNIEAERIEMFNLSAAEGPKWADTCNHFTQKIRTLGPSPILLALCDPGSKGGGSNDRG
jgi:coenzyme F420-reducing hydrogenase delta subunit